MVKLMFPKYENTYIIRVFLSPLATILGSFVLVQANDETTVYTNWHVFPKISALSLRNPVFKRRRQL